MVADAVTFSTGVENITSVVSSVMSIISGNAIFMTFLAAGLIGVAIGVIKSLARR